MKSIYQTEQDKFDAREKARLEDREKFQEKQKELVEEGKQKTLN